MFVFIFFGPIAVCGTFYLQLGYLSIESILSGVILGCLSVTLLCVNNIRDVSTDKIAGKRTIAVRFGIKIVKIIFIMLFFVSYVLSGYLAFSQNFININLHLLEYYEFFHDNYNSNPIIQYQVCQKEDVNEV